MVESINGILMFNGVMHTYSNACKSMQKYAKVLGFTVSDYLVQIVSDS